LKSLPLEQMRREKERERERERERAEGCERLGQWS